MTRAEALVWGWRVCVRVEIPGAVADLVTERQGGKYCVACRGVGLVAPLSSPLQLDHIRPLHCGGDNHHSNLRWLCQSHNAGRAARKHPPKRPRWERERST